MLPCMLFSSTYFFLAVYFYWKLFRSNFTSIIVLCPRPSAVWWIIISTYVAKRKVNWSLYCHVYVLFSNNRGGPANFP